MTAVNEEFRDVHARGLSDADLAARFAKSPSWVCRMRQRLGLDPNRPPYPSALDDSKARSLHARGLVDREIAAKLGVSRELVQKWRVKNDVPSNGWGSHR